MKKILVYAGSIVAASLLAAGAGQAKASAATDVGMWYATWYSKVPAVNNDWLTNFGGSSLKQFVGDVNGDGKDDAITFNSGGTWNAALANGTSFGTPSQWVTGHGAGSDQQFLADVNGDGKADAIVYFNSTGSLYVALSSGSGFGSYTQWKSGFGTNATKLMFADVNGDAKQDALAFFSATGTWQVALSSGTTFGTTQTWATGFGTNSTNQFAADTNKDGKADAIYFTGSNGNWYKANSSGTSFGASAAWTAGHGVGSSMQYVYDGNADGYAEPHLYFNHDLNADGKIGDIIGREYDRSLKAIAADDIRMNSGFGYQATSLMQGNVTGDLYGWKANIAFYAGIGGGTWKVERYRQLDTVSTDTWLGFPGKPALNYRPLTLGSYQTYDSGDAAVIDEHLATIADAKVDWLLLDETNGLNNVSGAILNRAKRLAERIKLWNDDPAKRDVRYAFAIGRVQWTNDPLTIEQEAGQVWEEFANHAAIGGANYYYQLNGKPILVIYANTNVQTAWKNYTGDKTNTNHFTIRFASSALAGEYGWQLPQSGTVDHDEVMVVMPGWNNHVAGYTPVLRNKGTFYIQSSWNKVLQRAVKPKIVVINSFNEFAEDTGIQIADTSGLTGTSEKWTDSSGAINNAMYWNMTKNFINQLKNPASTYSAAAGFGSTQGAGGWSYQEWSYSGTTRTVNPMTWDAANSRWKGTTAYSLIGSNWQHPDINKESVRVFTAPASGTVTITGTIAKQTAQGDGVKVKIRKNDQDFWPAGGGYITITDTTGYNVFVTSAVNANDQFQFIVNSNGTIDYDGTNWNPTITYN
ncbi:FG-GAP-like repeat-containing protein [Paenibacillus nasutitermitis]|uniref:VCBS repeat-containing protein n=1 Tax=Paenibacillus nasutitermitis TaxID=1652958 RepID=A0A916ZHR2_9BACL|nr:FG-GAP-like repeat-containing protein [Paenibacillus nasutitermitis]GGD98691.1 hypothetical protein GCM10010911_66900 [Paenibacillus nasutitermitis]